MDQQRDKITRHFLDFDSLNRGIQPGLAYRTRSGAMVFPYTNVARIGKTRELADKLGANASIHARPDLNQPGTIAMDVIVTPQSRNQRLHVILAVGVCLVAFCGVRFLLS